MYGYDVDVLPGGEQTTADGDKYDVNGYWVNNAGIKRAQSAFGIGCGGTIADDGDNPRLYSWLCAMEIGGSQNGLWFAPPKSGTSYTGDYGIDMHLAVFYDGCILIPNGSWIKGRNYANNANLPLMYLSPGDQILIGQSSPAGINLGYAAAQDNPISIRVGGMNSKAIEVGAIDSGGTGYRMLRVAN